MEPDIIGAQEELALAEIVERIIFRRCNRLVNELAIVKNYITLQNYTLVKPYFDIISIL